MALDIPLEKIRTGGILKESGSVPSRLTPIFMQFFFLLVVCANVYKF